MRLEPPIERESGNNYNKGLIFLIYNFCKSIRLDGRPEEKKWANSQSTHKGIIEVIDTLRKIYSSLLKNAYQIKIMR